MDAIIAQQPAPPSLRHFDIADGFAITLILMLFLVLSGVAVVAARFRRRENRSSDEEALDELMGGSRSDEAPSSPSHQVPSSGRQESSWERDGDWWRQTPDGED